MAIGKASDFVIYEEQFFGGMSEVIEQQANAFNEASNNTIQLVPQRLVGNYEKESFMKLISGLVSRRDTTSTAGVTDAALTMGEHVSVKLNRKIGPVAQTLDAFRKLGTNNEEISFVLGQQMGKAVAVEYLDSVTTALVAAITTNSLVYDNTVPATKTLTHTAMVEGLALFGDAAANLACWVMHSKPYFDLMKQSIADKIFEIAGVTIYAGTVATFNRPVVVMDAAPLLTAGSPNTYSVLSLVEGAAVVKESEEREVVSDTITGLENLVIRVQGEYAYTLGLKGYGWDVTNGGANPAGAAVGTGSNWDKVATHNKSTAGVLVKCQ